MRKGPKKEPDAPEAPAVPTVTPVPVADAKQLEDYKRNAAALKLTKGLTAEQAEQILNSPEGLTALCRRHAPDVFARLLELTDSSNEATALNACKEVLTRAYGEAPKSMVKTESFAGKRVKDRVAVLLAKQKGVQDIAIIKKSDAVEGEIVDTKPKEENENNDSKPN